MRSHIFSAENLLLVLSEQKRREASTLNYTVSEHKCTRYSVGRFFVSSFTTFEGRSGPVVIEGDRQEQAGIAVVPL